MFLQSEPNLNFSFLVCSSDVNFRDSVNPALRDGTLRVQFNNWFINTVRGWQVQIPVLAICLHVLPMLALVFSRQPHPTWLIGCLSCDGLSVVCNTFFLCQLTLTKAPHNPKLDWAVNNLGPHWGVLCGGASWMLCLSIAPFSLSSCCLAPTSGIRRHADRPPVLRRLWENLNHQLADLKN